MKKKLLVYAHYFYPDVASTGQILTELCEGLQEDFDITVICVVPSYYGIVDQEYKKKRIYKEKYQNIILVRVRVSEFNKKNKISRIKNILAYFFNAIYATIKIGKQDIVFSISQPPILGGLLGVVGKVIKRAKFVYNIQDFNPEQTMAIGYSKNKLLLKTAMFLDKFSCKRADKIIVVGRDMQETLKDRFKNKKIPNNTFINNWTDEKEIYPLAFDHPKVIEFKKKYRLKDKFIFEYSGNLGLYYDLPNIMKVIKEFRDRDDLVFIFIGGGSIKDELAAYKEEYRMDNVVFIPYQSKENLIYSLNVADVHWVVNAKGIKGVSVPSKLYGIMAAGKPVLGVLDKGSEARIIVEETGCGSVIEPGEYKGISELIDKMVNSKSSLDSVGMRGRNYLEKHLTKSVAIQKYSEIIKNI